MLLYCPPSLNDKFPLSNDHLPYDDDDSLHPGSLYTTFRPTRSPSFITAPSLPHAPSPLLYPLVSIPTHTPLCATASFFFPTFLGFAFALKTFMTALPLSLQRSRNSFANTVLLPPLGLPLALHFLRLLDIHTHTCTITLFNWNTPNLNDLALLFVLPHSSSDALLSSSLSFSERHSTHCSATTPLHAVSAPNATNPLLPYTLPPKSTLIKSPLSRSLEKPSWLC